MIENPYASTDIDEPQPTALGVQGNFLVLRSGTELPSFCILTGTQIEQGVRARLALRWKGRRGQRLVFARRCEVSFSISPSLRYRLSARRVAEALLVLGLVGAICAAIAFSATDSLFSLVCLGAGACTSAFACWLSTKRIELKVFDERDGWFWVYGFSVAFLNRVRESIREQLV